MPGTENGYLAEAAEKYERITSDKMNDEGVCMLLEAVHENINNEMNDLASVLSESYMKVKNLPMYKETEYVNVFLKFEDFYNREVKRFKVRNPGKSVSDYMRTKFINKVSKMIENLYNLNKDELKYVVTLHSIEKMRKLLKSKYYNGISLGHGNYVLNNFEELIKNALINHKRRKRKICMDDMELINVPSCEEAENVRERMKKWREINHLDCDEVARKIGIGAALLKMIENGEVTHPDICRKIQKVYNLTDAETEYLMPEIHRKSSDKYEPNKYKISDDQYLRMPMIMKTDDFVKYLHERKEEAARKHDWRGMTFR